MSVFKTIANRFDAFIPAEKLSVLCWSIVLNLLGFLFITQLTIITHFTLKLRITFYIAPAALLIALVIGYLYAKKEGMNRNQILTSILISIMILAFSFLLANAFYDMSWDGLWYHQTAVYQMAHGWNPHYDPLHNFAPNLRDWLRFYAKGPWYFALAIFNATDNIEMAKSEIIIAAVISFITCFALMIDLGQKKRNALIIAALIAFNPVITCQLVSYLVDGLMISFLVIFIASMINWYRKPTSLFILIAIFSAVLCINTKFTGLVYICFFIAAGGIF